jgi:hypothetical protein
MRASLSVPPAVLAGRIGANARARLVRRLYSDCPLPCDRPGSRIFQLSVNVWDLLRRRVRVERRARLAARRLPTAARADVDKMLTVRAFEAGRPPRGSLEPAREGARGPPCRVTSRHDDAQAVAPRTNILGGALARPPPAPLILNFQARARIRALRAPARAAHIPTIRAGAGRAGPCRPALGGRARPPPRRATCGSYSSDTPTRSTSPTP